MGGGRRRLGAAGGGTRRRRGRRGRHVRPMQGAVLGRRRLAWLSRVGARGACGVGMPGACRGPRLFGFSIIIIIQQRGTWSFRPSDA
ncbi:hypothetical protein NL676_027889 [Syzygium grande]|nr:hypothetical protein NL676_027889 [Syzygium grande]